MKEKMMSKKRILVFILTTLLLTFTIWLSGYDFDKRDPVIALVFLGSIMVSFLAATFPGLDD